MTNAQVQDFPVVMILIVGTRVSVDTEPVIHDGSLPLAEVALAAVVARTIRSLGRPVRAVATDETGTSTLIVGLDGRASDVERISDTQSTYFPESLSPEQPALVPLIAIGQRLRKSSSRVRLVSIALVGAVALVAAVTAAINTGTTNPSQLIEPKTTAAAATPHAAPTDTPSALPAARPVPRITGVARQRPGGPLRLAIRSSVSPLSVRIELVGANAKVIERNVVISGAKGGKDGRTVVLFAKLLPRKYQWRVSAMDASDISGTFQVRAAPPPPSAPEPIPTPVVVTAPSTPPSSQPTRPTPSGPRDNNPIPPTPQP